MDDDKPFPMPHHSNRTGGIVYQSKAVAEVTLETLKEPADSLGLTVNEFQFILESILSPSQHKDITLVRFITHYMTCRNASQAAREVGWPEAKGIYIRKNPLVHACISALTTKEVMKYGYDVNDVVKRVREVSEFDPIEIENPDGTFKKSLTQIRPEVRRVIKKIKCKNIMEDDPNGMPRVRGEIIEIEFHDKMEAHRLLAREKNTFKETRVLQHDVTTNMKETLLGAAKRAEERAVGSYVEIEGKTITDAGEADGALGVKDR